MSYKKLLSGVEEELKTKAEKDITEYKKDFWDIIIRNRNELGINNLEFVKLQNIKDGAFVKYNNFIMDVRKPSFGLFLLFVLFSVVGLIDFITFIISLF